MKKIIFLFTSTAFLLISHCVPQKEENAEGSIPNDWKADQQAFALILSSFPSPPVECNSRLVTIEGLARTDTEDCSSYHFEDLYKQAKMEAESRIRSLQCPEGCQLKTWEVGRKGRCIPFEEQDDHVIMRVMIGAGCYNSDNEPPVSIPSPNEDHFTNLDSLNKFRPYPMSPLTESWDDFLRPDKIECGKTIRYEFTYSTPVDDCESPDFMKFIGEAKSHARNIWNRIPCENDQNCNKGEFSVLRTEWKCNEQDPKKIEVKVFFEITCEN